MAIVKLLTCPPTTQESGGVAELLDLRNCKLCHLTTQKTGGVTCTFRNKCCVVWLCFSIRKDYWSLWFQFAFHHAAKSICGALTILTSTSKLLRTIRLHPAPCRVNISMNSMPQAVVCGSFLMKPFRMASFFAIAKTSQSLSGLPSTLCHPPEHSSVPSLQSDFVSLHSLPLQRSFSPANLKIFYQFKKSQSSFSGI